ncbi:MAG: PIG-L family deacetylase [Oscillospiraceae bacterium]|nr:PIG-L family deacetylase [Oscillospiraceae bacterium]
MNILAIGAHPDDVEISCGGTLAKYAKQGHKVFTATATNGNVGSSTLSMDEIAKIRKEEAKRAAAVIGAEYICLDYDDEMFFEDRAARLAFIDLVRYCKADVILTHNPDDYNPDHMLTSKIVGDTAVMIPVAKIQTKNKPHDKIPAIAYFEPVHGVGFIPTEYVDITDTIEAKMEMCRAHESQISWMQDNYKDYNGSVGGGSFFDDYYTIARYRGIQCGVRFAEGFRMSNFAYRTVPYRVLP